MGSTAVPGVSKAKPIIDLIPVVRDLDRVGRAVPEMRARGYDFRGEYGIAGRRYFSRVVKDGGAVEGVHVHTYQAGDREIARHVGFVEYLNAHPVEAAAYSRLKQNLANRHGDDRRAYTEAKTEMIHEIDRRAAESRLKRGGRQ